MRVRKLKEKKKKSIILLTTQIPLPKLKKKIMKHKLIGGKFNKFLKKKDNNNESFNQVKRINKKEGSFSTLTCYTCEKTRYIKMKCPTLQKKVKKYKKKKNDKKRIRAYITWNIMTWNHLMIQMKKEYNMYNN
ncbi:hypothetical protein CR513_18692, partial [Mucuna pruriens]